MQTWKPALIHDTSVLQHRANHYTTVSPLPVDIDILMRTSKPIHPSHHITLTSLVLTEQHFQGVHNAALLRRITNGGVEQTDRRHDLLVAGIGISLACLPANIQPDIHKKTGCVLYACCTMARTSRGDAQHVILSHIAATVHYPADALDARGLVHVGTAGCWAWCDRVAETATSAVRDDTHGGVISTSESCSASWSSWVRSTTARPLAESLEAILVAVESCSCVSVE